MLDDGPSGRREAGEPMPGEGAATGGAQPESPSWLDDLRRLGAGAKELFAAQLSLLS